MTVGDIRERVGNSLLVDAGFIAGIAALLVAIHFATPPGLKSALAFDHQKFDLWTLITSAYVHTSLEHLLYNVAGFLIAAVMVLNICRHLGDRRWFYATSLILLVVLPILVNLTSYAILEAIAPEATHTGRGFSGVGAGFLGFVLAGFLVWTAKQSSWTTTKYIGYGIALLLAFEIAVIYSGIRLDLLGVTVAGLALTGWGFTQEVNLDDNRHSWGEWLPDVGLGVVILVFIGLFILLLFPADIVDGNMIVNIFAHAAGFVYGNTLALAIWRVLESPQSRGLMA